MKLAVIAPPEYLDIVANDRLGYHMALGQELFRDRHYYQWYRTFAERGHFIIVDNGAAEPEEERVSFDNIAHAALELGADEIILPDVLRDKYETLERSLDPRVLFRVPSYRRMIVPQGKNWDEWATCMVDLVIHSNPASIGIAKHLEDFEGGRVKALEIITRFEYHKSHAIHLLGVRRHPFKEVLRCLQMYDGIRGIDTGAPIAYAQHKAPINDSQHFSLKWESTGKDTLYYHNVERYARWIASAHLRVKDEIAPQTAKS